MHNDIRHTAHFKFLSGLCSWLVIGALAAALVVWALAQPLALGGLVMAGILGLSLALSSVIYLWEHRHGN